MHSHNTCHSILKSLSVLSMLLLSLGVCLTLSSCGDDNDEPAQPENNASALIGTWEAEFSASGQIQVENISTPVSWSADYTSTIIFQADGGLYSTTRIPGSLDQGGGIGPGTITGNYRYVADGKTISIFNSSQSNEESPMSILSYHISENKLTLSLSWGTKFPYIPPYIINGQTVYDGETTITYTRK